MAQEMTLNLKLTGVMELVKAIRELDKALTKVNVKFTNVATSVSQAAQKISQAVGTAKGVTLNSPSNSSTGGSKGGSKSSDPFNDQGMSSIFFSAIQGQWRSVFSKVATRFGSTPVGKFFPGMASGFGGGGAASSLQTVFGAVKQFGKLALVIGLVIGGFILLIKGIMAIIQAIAQAVIQTAKLVWASGGNTNVSRSLRGIGASAGFSQEQMAGMIRDPSQGKILLMQLDILRKMDTQSASRYANAMGIDPDLAQRVHDMSSSDWVNARGNANGPSGFTQNVSKMAATEWTAAVGQFKDGLSQLWETLAPVLILFADGLKTAAFAIKLFAKGLEFGFQMIIKLADFLVPALHLEEAFNKMKSSVNGANESLDQFSKKVGTFGGKERANSPIPTAFSYYGYQNKLTQMSDALGAFEF